MENHNFNPITLENPIFKSLILYSCILVVKMMGMSILTVLKRFLHKRKSSLDLLQTVISPEDAEFFHFQMKINENVERIRRAHQNDLENILIFFTTGFFYIMTNPSELIAVNLFRIYTLIRVLHTFVYAIYVIPQPTRAIIWTVGYCITGYMAFITIWEFLSTSY